MVTRLYEDDQNRRRDQHACALRDLYFWRLLRDRILWSAGAILEPGRNVPSSWLDVVHDTATRSTRDARSECVPDARSDESKKLYSKSELAHLRVDGGITNGGTSRWRCLLEDVGGFEVVRPKMRESTAFGSALLAASAVGFGWDITGLKRSRTSIPAEANVRRRIIGACKLWMYHVG